MIEFHIEPRTQLSFSLAGPASVDFGMPEYKVIHDSGDPYTGDYEVTPDFDGRVLLTNGKCMTDDVTVNPIQVERTSNPQGGRTVYIGGQING